MIVNMQASIDRDFNQKLTQLKEKHTVQLNKVHNRDGYANDIRVQNELVVSTLNTLQGIGFNVDYIHFVLFFSILMSILLEMTIFLSFYYCTTIFLPIFEKQQSNFIEQEELREIMRNINKKDEMIYSQFKEKVRNAKSNTVETLKIFNEEKEMEGV